jgi:hypothetical protein
MTWPTKQMSVKMELLNGSSNAVKDQIIADANAKTSIRDAFNALVDGATVSTKAYFQMISRRRNITRRNDTGTVYTSVENKTARRVVRSKFTRQMYRDEDSESTEMQSSMVVFQSSTKRRREPYLLGAVARSDAQLIAMTIDQMVSKANNVPKEEALTVWGLPYKSYDSLGHIRRPISAN